MRAAAFAGVTPPTTLVPYSIICVAWKVPSVPVKPCTSIFGIFIDENAHSINLKVGQK